MFTNALLWALAVILGFAPRRLWGRLEPLPMASAAVPAALFTLAVGFYAGLHGFLAFAARVASADNSVMLRTIAQPTANPYAAALMPYGTSAFTPFVFLLTPLGLLCAYLVVSGATRAISAWFGDPRGDFVLSLGASLVGATAHTLQLRRTQRLRERLEGPDAPDVLRPGSWCNVPADYVVLSARRKPEWDAGAIVMAADDWYRLGVPFDMDTPAGLRTVYPLVRMETAEVVRRGIHYQLPKLPRDPYDMPTTTSRLGDSATPDDR